MAIRSHDQPMLVWRHHGVPASDLIGDRRGLPIHPNNVVIVIKFPEQYELVSRKRTYLVHCGPDFQSDPGLALFAAEKEGARKRVIALRWRYPPHSIRNWNGRAWS